MSRMRAGAVLGEARRNLVSGTSRAGLLGAVFIVLVGLLAVLDVRAVVGVLDGAARFRAAGATVAVLKSEGSVDGRRCDALGGTGALTFAGAIRRGEPVQFYAMPAAQVGVVEVTPGLIELLPVIAQPARTNPLVAGGVWLSADLAATLGAGPGSVLLTASGPVTVAGVYTWPDDGRARDLGYTVVAPVPADGRFDQCWTETWPTDAGLTGLSYIAAAGAGVGQPPTLGQLNTSLGTTYDAARLLTNRLTAPAPWAAAVIGLALGYLAVRIRRVELASALHARVPRAHVGWGQLLEAGAWAVGGAVVVCAGLLWAARLGNPDPGWVTWLIGVRTVVAGTAAVLVGVVVGVLTTREKHLFRYAKDR